MIALSVIGLVVGLVPLLYLYLLVYGTLRPRRDPLRRETGWRYAIAVPAHDEASVIAQTVARLREMDRPAGGFDIYVVADHCTDATADAARRAGAVCLERTAEPKGSKGAALGWLFDRIWETEIPYGAIVVFDADTQVDPAFLRAMEPRLAQGEQVIQGQHRISNPGDGWYPALTWAMFLVDNRIQNQGRANLGFSAKNMGDSICFRSEVLRRVGWGEGLTEDYELRHRLLEQGVRIAYEPAAIGYGEAPATWAIARHQRQRWLAGTVQSSEKHLGRLLRAALRRRDLALLDGIAQMVLPSYSTLTVLVVAALLLQLGTIWLWSVPLPAVLLILWFLALGSLVAYPLLGLMLEGAPLRAYLVMLTGPVFVVWRTGLAVVSRLGGRSVTWVRTPRRAER